MNFGIFRKKALDSYLRPDAPAGLVAILPPSTVIVFGVMFLLFGGLGLATIFGRAQIVASGRGIVKLDHPPIVLHARRAGKIAKIERTHRDHGSTGEVILSFDMDETLAASQKCATELDMERGDLAALEKRAADWNDGARVPERREASTALVLLSQIRTQREKVNVLAQRCEAHSVLLERSMVRFPVAAAVIDIAVSAGAEVKEGDALVSLAPSSSKLVGYVAFPEARRADIAPGQSVKFRFDALPADEVGSGSGRILRLLEVLPTGVKLDQAESDGVISEVSIDVMPGAAQARQGMTFEGAALTRRVSIASLLFAGDP
jgi:hypothetical protein